VRVTCPACHAEMSLDVLLGREADARALAAFLEGHVRLGDALVRYVSLFRPPKRRLAIARVVGLLGELLHDIERGAINRRGRDWPCGDDTWRTAIDTLLAKRDKNALTLPLSSHGLLYEVMAGLADKAEAAAEAVTEATRRDTRTPGRSGAAKPLAELAVAAQGAAAQPVASQPPADYSKPSRAARELQARIAATLKARAGQPQDDVDPAQG
jgi:hypothetical protein